MNHSCNYHLIILDQYQCIQFCGKFSSFLCLHVGIRLEEGAPYDQMHSLILSVLKMKKNAWKLFSIANLISNCSVTKML
jgi:hypothetical protein